MPIQPRAAILRVNSGLEPAQLRTLLPTGMSASASARKARTSARSVSHGGGNNPGLMRRACIGGVSSVGERRFWKRSVCWATSVCASVARHARGSVAMSAASPTPGGPLAGVRVLDLTAVVLGPIATQILGDYGADVIKVEAPGGDRMRTNGVSRHRGMGSIFLAINRNKRSLCIDLKSAAGVDVIRRLLPTVDVLVHNMRRAAVDRLGLGYEAVSALNPRLVYFAPPGF